MKKKIYLLPVTECYSAIIDTSILLDASKLTGQGQGGLVIGYGDEDDEDDVVVSTNHTRVWDEMGY